MKTIFTLALLVISSTLFAHPNDGKLTVTNLSGQEIMVEVDGKLITSRNNQYFILPQLATGFHNIKVTAYDQTRKTAQMGLGRKRITLLQRSVNLKIKNHIDIVVNRFGKVYLDEMSMSDAAYRDEVDDRYEDDRGPRDNNGGYNNGNNGGYNNGNGGYNNGNGGYNNNNGGYGNNYRPMSDQAFASFKDVVARERFDNARVSMAKQVIDQNYFTVDQVKQLLQLFSFDNYKLDLAKTAYKNTVNRGEYFMIYEVFSFSSSKEDLAAFIKAYK